MAVNTKKQTPLMGPDLHKQTPLRGPEPSPTPHRGGVAEPNTQTKQPLGCGLSHDTQQTSV